MLKLVSAAETSPVTLDELKGHCRVDFDDDDDQLQIYLDAATEFVAGRIGLVLAPTTYRIDRRDWWGGDLEILVAPIRDISEVSYVTADGVTHIVDPQSYEWERTDIGGRLSMRRTFAGLISDRNDAVKVVVEAGYDNPAATGSGEDPALSLPTRVKQTILLIAAHWNENREATLVADRAAATDLPLAAEALMSQMRIYR